MKKLLALLLVLVMVCSVTAAAEGTEGTEAPAFNRADEATWDVTVEIAAIMPYAGVYRDGAIISSYKTNYTEAVCQCLTTEGEIAWLYIDIDDYNLFFDESASVHFDQFLSFSMVALPEPVRVDGTTTDAESLAEGLSESIESDTVIYFGNAEVLSGETIPDTAYTAETPALTRVNAAMVSPVPACTLAAGGSAAKSPVARRAKAADGSDVWVGMSIAAYNATIDESASLGISGMARFSEMTYETPLVLHGICMEADSLAKGLADAAGSDTVIWFGRAEG